MQLLAPNDQYLRLNLRTLGKGFKLLAHTIIARQFDPQRIKMLSDRNLHFFYYRTTNAQQTTRINERASEDSQYCFCFVCAGQWVKEGFWWNPTVCVYAALLGRSWRFLSSLFFFFAACERISDLKCLCVLQMQRCRGIRHFTHSLLRVHGNLLLLATSYFYLGSILFLFSI